MTVTSIHIPAKASLVALVEKYFATVDRMTILLMEQNAVQSLAVAHRAYIIENGAVAMQGEASELARNPGLRKNYLGL